MARISASSNSHVSTVQTPKANTATASADGTKVLILGGFKANGNLAASGEAAEVYDLGAGRFDPVTNGHLDIVERSLQVFDELVLGFASQVADARSRQVVHLGVERTGDWKAEALRWLHPRALDVARIRADLDASLSRRFALRRERAAAAL